jgi:hypothetical protein
MVTLRQPLGCTGGPSRMALEITLQQAEKCESFGGIRWKLADPGAQEAERAENRALRTYLVA